MSTLNPTQYSTPGVNMPADIEYDRHQTIATLLSGEAIARPNWDSMNLSCLLNSLITGIAQVYFGNQPQRIRTQINSKYEYDAYITLRVEVEGEVERVPTAVKAFHFSDSLPGATETYKLEAFYAAETSLSNQDRTRLTIASGRENSDIGLILHVAFWDPESPTIQLLHGKGLGDEALFGYDWHWRAECSDDRRKPQYVAKILPLPFLIVAGVCPANSYTKFLDKSAKFVEVIISPPDGKIKFCLEFDTEAAIFYAKPALIHEITMRLDAGLNMILWLLGKKYTVDYFIRKGSICQYTRWTPNGFERGLKGAPLTELHAHRKQETNSGKHLKISCYSAPFLEWTASYLGEDPNSILQRGLSLANAIQDEISAKISHKSRIRTQKLAGRCLNDHDSGSTEAPSSAPISDQSRQQSSQRQATENSESVTSSSFSSEEIMQALQWLTQTIEKGKEYADWSSPFAQLSPHQLLSMEREMAVAEALFTLRRQNINEALDENERDKKISNMENALRVKLHSVRKKYGVVIKPRRCKHATASTDPAKLMNPTTLQTVYASHHSSALSDGNSPTPGNVVPRARRKLQDWRETLLQDETFQISGARRDRMRIHLPFKLDVKIPAAADPLAVFLQCHLVQDGSQHHTNYFATDALFGDPARRLGIQIRYQELETSLRETRTEWVTATGLVNAQKTDLLVGLLEHRSEIDTDGKLRPGSALEDHQQTVTSCPKLRHERKPNSSEGTGNENSVFKIGYKYLEGTATGFDAYSIEGSGNKKRLPP
ncbi:hypothetical protein O1611_g1768 [Lasiodiplodia mahajangana]|uniref:Uncharacterized protein n=1 Tax=Lasiodiplodia mahajangana TaxID=1108764 RepID=A0ACC2JWF5_9PEZI|nr:hypothetical protein O1611_g1768 [Lasiodiplodia mahajangana]